MRLRFEAAAGRLSRRGQAAMTAFRFFQGGRVMRRSILAAMACLAMLPELAASAQSVVTYHNTQDRAGAYTVPGLTQTVAASLHKDTGFNATVSGNVYAQPLYWKPSGAATGLLIVATESNLVYALNANTGAEVWKAQLAAPIPGGQSGGVVDCGDIDPEGVTGTPVIDPATGVLYLDATTLQSGDAAVHEIYSLSLANGKVIPKWPLSVDAAMSADHAAFSSKIQGERSALQFLDGKLYVTYGGRGGDCDQYHGVVIEITPSQHAITASWATRAVRGGIWSQGGAASDGSSLFVTTGNTTGAQSWGDGEAVLRLRPGLARPTSKANYFTPSNWLALDNGDLDIGGTAAIPFTIPTTPKGTASRILALGKDGNAYLLNGANLGGIGAQLSTLKVSNSPIITASAVYNGKISTLVAFRNANGASANCSGGNLTMLKVTDNATKPLTLDWCAPLAGAGAPIVTTTDGSANPIVWATGAEGDNLLHGFDVLTGKTIFAGAGATMTGLHRYSTILAANRHLYIGADGRVYAFTF
jgi:outer membrane protein assembly factor BamB